MPGARSHPRRPHRIERRRVSYLYFETGRDHAVHRGSLEESAASAIAVGPDLRRNRLGERGGGRFARRCKRFSRTRFSIFTRSEAPIWSCDATAEQFGSATASAKTGPAKSPPCRAFIRVIGSLMDLVAFEQYDLFMVMVNGWPLDSPVLDRVGSWFLAGGCKPTIIAR